MAKERKREDKRAGNEWEGFLSEKEVIQNVERPGQWGAWRQEK